VADQPVRVGSVWGLIRSNGEISITLWGDFSQDVNTSPEIPLFIPKTYHLATGLPCIDRGLSLGAPAMDLDGEVRPIHHLSGQKVDVGADELSPDK
jgi:hypothetical protein